jgi:ABC-type nickel/cobalt efflux system permease component RcnA
MRKAQMGEGRKIIAGLTALALFLALAVAPLFLAVTRAPMQLAVEADHAAWHAEAGEHRTATDHDHHGATDHDPSITVLQTVGEDRHPPRLTDRWTARANQRSGIIRDGPRRPPRLT